MQNVNELKKCVDQMCELLSELGNVVEAEDDMGDTARAELGMYMMYLSASDGKIAWQEAKVISEICGAEFTPAEVKDFIEEGEIYSESFESTVPESFRLIVAADQARIETGGSKDELISDAAIGLYQEIGELLLKSDGDLTQNEVADYKIYITMLVNYQKAHL